MIGIIDYGMGNLGSVTNACEFLSLDARIITRTEEMRACEAIILPGVGAFRDCMEHLAEHKFDDEVRSWIASKKPFLGICLGLQVLFERSEESPDVLGLGVFQGTVRRFSDAEQKVPQIGWNRVSHTAEACPLFREVPEDSFFYFVHSYYVDAADESLVAGTTSYGIDYTSMIWKENVMAVQFHPEKSQRLGLRMLQNFADLVARTEVSS